MFEHVNYTFMTFIPKVKKAQNVGDYRLINLCNVSSKIVANVLANRLKSVLIDIISPNQNVFVLKMLIFYNIFITYEPLTL